MGLTDVLRSKVQVNLLQGSQQPVASHEIGYLHMHSIVAASGDFHEKYAYAKKRVAPAYLMAWRGLLTLPGGQFNGWILKPDAPAVDAEFVLSDQHQDTAIA